MRPAPPRPQDRITRKLQKGAKGFDIESGQVYLESHVRVGPRHHSDWIGELKTPSLAKAIYPSPEGARTLLDQAKLCAIKQVRDLRHEHFAMIPWSIARGIWEEIVARYGVVVDHTLSTADFDSRRESFHAWRVFAQTYPSASEFGALKYRYHLHIKQPSLALEDYLRGITSEQLSWLTCLRLSPKENRVSDLVALADMPNLAILDLSDGQVAIDIKVSSFDERVMRTWAELAEKEGKLKHLRVILLGWQEHVSPSWLFKHLSSFPLLRHVIITDCPRIHQKNRKEWEPIALERGWEARRAKRSAKSLRPMLNEQGFHVGAVSGLLFSDQEISSRTPGVDVTETHLTKPVLECWLGTPRAWTHILDDFPSTRTIFFDRVEGQTPLSDAGETRVSKDPVKRARNHEHRSIEVRSPPPKRASKPVMKLKPGLKGASDLLNEFSHH